MSTRVRVSVACLSLPLTQRLLLPRYRCHLLLICKRCTPTAHRGVAYLGSESGELGSRPSPHGTALSWPSLAALVIPRHNKEDKRFVIVSLGRVDVMADTCHKGSRPRTIDYLFKALVVSLVAAAVSCIKQTSSTNTSSHRSSTAALLKRIPILTSTTCLEGSPHRATSTLLLVPLHARVGGPCALHLHQSFLTVY